VIIRGGRPNEVAYYVDGFSQQDPLTGVSTTAINGDAIEEIVVQTGGFNAEYGRVNSGAINIITREGGDKYFGSAEGVFGDWMKRNRGYKNFNASLGGPIAPSMKQVTFYAAAERKDVEDRRPSIITDQVADPSQPGLFENGVLPSNGSKTWSGVGKLSFKLSPLMTLKLGGTYNQDKWQQFQNPYRFDLEHAPRFRDKNYSAYGTWNHSLNTRSYYEVKANYFLTDRIRGTVSTSTTSRSTRFRSARRILPSTRPRRSSSSADNPAGPHVLTTSCTGIPVLRGCRRLREPDLEVAPDQDGGDYQRHTLRYYDHYYRPALRDSAGVLLPKNTLDVDRYGYDAFGNDISGGLDGPKHPKVGVALWPGQVRAPGPRRERGLRFDYQHERARRAGRDDDPVGLHLQSKSVPVEPTDGLAQGRDSERRGVARAARLQCDSRGLNHAFGRGEIGLAMLRCTIERPDLSRRSASLTSSITKNGAIESQRCEITDLGKQDAKCEHPLLNYEQAKKACRPSVPKFG